MKNDCQPAILVKTAMIRVTHCPDCGCVSLDIGAFSVRINDEILEQFSEALTEAVTRLTLVKRGNSWLTQRSEQSDIH